ncbi:MAG TPA: hypothetical protein VKO86_05220 [Gemmatimonadales bacterium]|nr:hypothetical protein [Gemmatimonadales bacterium]
MTSPVGRAGSGADAGPAERASLSRELSEFLIELSIALHKHAMYPLGHPSLAPAVARMIHRGEALLQDRPSLSLGVARNQLVIEGVATDPKHPVLAELAGRLHRHHLGAVTFSRGIEPGEVADMLRTLAVEADRTGQPLGMGDPAKLSAWKHVRLHPMTYERLELLDQAPQVAPDAAAEERSADDAALARDARVRGAQLWIGLARAALAGQIGEDEAPPTRPAVIAKAIDEHAGGAAYDQVIVGYLLQIAQELKAAGGQEALELRRRTSRLLSEMRPDTLRRLIEMGGDSAQRRQFVLDASHGMAVDAVLEVIKAAADASQRTVSSSLMRMLSKLASHAEQGTPHARSLADTALRDQVRSLLTGWDLEDPNPSGYGAALQRMSQAGPSLLASMEPMHAAEPERLVQMSLEVNALGPHVFRACAELLDSGRLTLLMDLLEQAPGTVAAEEMWSRAASPETLRWILGNEPVDFAVADRLLLRLAERAAEPLLDALASSETRATRRAILERLVRLGPALGPSITARLTDERWYVKRNLLTLLDLLPEPPPGFSALEWLSDPDPRVRVEALKLGLKNPAERERVITRGLADGEHRIARHALMAAQEGVLPVEAVPHVVAMVRNRNLPPDVRVPAIRLLGSSQSPQALETLLALADGGRTLLGKRKLPPKSRELLAALTALASGWGMEPRAMEVLLVAAVSRDPQLRAATDPEKAAL